MGPPHRSASAERLLRQLADDSRPFAYPPLRDEPVDDVRIWRRELLGNGRRGALEQQHRPVDRIRERAAEDERAALDRPPRVLQMRRPERRAALGVVLDDL